MKNDKSIKARLGLLGVDSKELDGVITYKEDSNTTVLYLQSGVKKLDISMNNPYKYGKLCDKVKVIGGAELTRLSIRDNCNITELEINLPNAKIGTFYYAFKGCSSLQKINIISIGKSKVKSMIGAFKNCSSLYDVNIQQIDTSLCRDFREIFAGCRELEKLDLSAWDTSKALDMATMFSECNSLKYVNTSGWNTSAVMTFCSMFCDCYELESIDLSHFDTRSLVSSEMMFMGCVKLRSINITGWNTSRLHTISNMFNKCEKLQTIEGASNISLSQLEYADYVFRGCTSLKSIDLSNWKIEDNSTLSMNFMFSGCENIEIIDLRNMKTENIIRWTKTFNRCIKLREIHLYNIGETNLIESSIFDRCPNISSIYFYDPDMKNNINRVIDIVKQVIDNMTLIQNEDGVETNIYVLGEHVATI